MTTVSHVGECEAIARELGAMTDQKDKAYGKSFDRCGLILEQLFPDGVKLRDYPKLLAMTRVVDKLFRIATDEFAFGEEPWKDIAGYALLMVRAQRAKQGLRANVDETGDDLVPPSFKPNWFDLNPSIRNRNAKD